MNSRCTASSTSAGSLAPPVRVGIRAAALELSGPVERARVAGACFAPKEHYGAGRVQRVVAAAALRRRNAANNRALNE